MKTNRRIFIHNMGVGAAGLSLAAPLALSSCAGPDNKMKSQGIIAGNGNAVTSSGRRKGQMWPIKSELKSKRIKFDTPQNQISWAFMKELREHNKTRKIYDINPYVEVYQFRDNLYGLFTENCDGAGDVLDVPHHRAGKGDAHRYRLRSRRPQGTR